MDKWTAPTRRTIQLGSLALLISLAVLPFALKLNAVVHQTVIRAATNQDPVVGGIIRSSYALGIQSGILLTCAVLTIVVPLRELVAMLLARRGQARSG